MQNLKGEFKDLALENLHISEAHERSTWKLGDLEKSIAENGIKVPLIVRARPRKLGGYEILDGARRKKAGDKAGVVRAPCFVVDVDDAVAIAMQLDANDPREPLHPVDEGAIFKRLVGLGWDEKVIAKRFQRKPRDVQRRLALNGLSAKARAAFVDGTIDEDAALALAGLDSAGKQNDYVGAIAAGTLQPEEVVATVRREQSAQLADVPWALSDATLDAKAGACVTCPKRSSHQRHLFDESTGERCLDVKCHAGKMEASFKHASKRPGIEVLTGVGARADSLFLPEAGRRPSLLQNSGKVDAEVACPYVRKGTWADAIARAGSADEPPVLLLAKDHDGRPRWLFHGAAVVKLVKRGDEATGQKVAAKEADPVRSDPEADAAKLEAKVRRGLMAGIYNAAATSENRAIWDWVTARLIDSTSAKDAAFAANALDSVRETMGTKASEDPRVMLHALAERSHEMAKRVALAILIREADEGDTFPEALTELAKVIGWDVKAAERKLRKGGEAEAK